MTGSDGSTKKWAMLKKFGYAIKGFFVALKEEKSLWVHLIATVLIIILTVILGDQLQKYEIAIIAIVICLVITVELINTAIENLCDLVSFKLNSKAKKIKDIAAAATLVTAITSIIVGLLIFIPAIIEFVNINF